MTWDRDKWLADWNASLGSTEIPTPERERAALRALRDITDEGYTATTTENVIGRNYKLKGEHIAHALWLTDLLDAHGITVGASPGFFRVVDPDKLRALDAEYEQYEASD